MKILIFFCLFICLASCDLGMRKNNANEHIVERKNVVKYAKHFAIYDYDTLQLIHIKDPNTGKIMKKYFISESLVYKDYKKLPNFLDKIITLSSTNIGMLSILDMEDAICGVSDKDYLYNATVKENIELGKTVELGDEATISTESIFKTKAQLIFFSGFGKEFQNSDILEQQNVLSIPIYDWEEHHPLGKAEWIVFFGYLCGKKEEAKEYFDMVTKQYSDICKILEDVKSTATIMSGNMIGDVWNCPGGKSYRAMLFKDAKLKYAYSKTDESGSLSLPFEKILEDNAEADFWFSPGFSTFTGLNAANGNAELFKSFKEQNVYCYSANQDKYWEMAASEPHHVLFDFVSICHPGILPDQTTYFFDKLTP